MTKNDRLKPRGDGIPEALKDLKHGFDNPVLDQREPVLYMAAQLSHLETVQAWRGEILHQLALRAERRGDAVKARFLYGVAADAFGTTDYLGLARERRDEGIMLCRNGDPGEGLQRLFEAVDIHQDDTPNEKGLRQSRVTEGYLLRARILTDDTSHRAMADLVTMALHECDDFCLRDQLVLVNFALQYADGQERRLLFLRKINIQARRRTLVGAGASIAELVIDMERSAATRAVAAILRKA